MNKLCFVIQGKTFLKSIMPIVAFCNRLQIIPVVFCYKNRLGKSYDSLNKNFIESKIKKLSELGLLKSFILEWVDNDSDIIRIMKKNNIYNIVCQDGQHHHKALCNELKINVFSICIFFDTLHYANRIKKSLVKDIVFPNVLYFPDKRFENDFNRMVPKFKSNFKSLGSPLYDHSLFIQKKDRENKAILFLTTLQNLVPEHMQLELEELIKYSANNNIEFFMKTKKKTPWVFKNKKIFDHVKIVEDEEGFPYTSMKMLINTDIHISSYSTSAVEAEFIGKPCINLESTPNDQLTYAVNSIKNDYNVSTLFQSNICKTISKCLIRSTEDLINLKHPTKEKLTFDSNNSIRILKDIKNYM